MRFVVLGAGAIGGVVGGCLYRAGHPVTLVARGAHLEAINDRGLVLELPGRKLVLDIPAVGAPAAVDWTDRPTVLMAVKSQDTQAALDALAASAPPETPVVCMQNGVENERRTARHFEHTYAMCVMCPATHLEPGIVQAHSAPVTALLDVGRFPGGVDATAAEVASALTGAGCDAVARPDVMRWKYRKLVANLLNAVDALCGQAARHSELARAAREEGEECLRRCGIEVASAAEDRERRSSLLTLEPTESGPHRGSSSWQSLARGTAVEADYLNGEIALLGRLIGFPTPVNNTLQRLANQQAASGAGPGGSAPEAILATARDDSGMR